MNGYHVAVMFSACAGILALGAALFAACEHISRVENAEGSEHPRRKASQPRQMGVAGPQVLPHSRRTGPSAQSKRPRHRA